MCPDIKRILSDTILFPGISEEDFQDLMKIGPFGGFDRKQLWKEYSRLKNEHDMFRIHSKAHRVFIDHA